MTLTGPDRESGTSEPTNLRRDEGHMRGREQQILAARNKTIDGIDRDILVSEHDIGERPETSLASVSRPRREVTKNL